ncbi:hypothetical protein GCM10012286_83340 [Streptomyces lasiicapitis]|uniref:Uncharacterized protein n=2 Tax=Streptomyces lasiicapitis TaxID=1923961 RepID=A0ABQ2MY42_9ACTN|nr:hypothetical protein GCM10012286_83340 [Streptomyces lasiicapitis]
MEYRDELADLTRERFGPRRDREQPVRYTAAFSLTATMASLLTEGDFAAFLQAALRASRDCHRPEPNWPFPRTFIDSFSRELRNRVGPFEEAEGRQEAWHIMFALHGILAPDLMGPFIRCAFDAWENTVECVSRRLAKT